MSRDIRMEHAKETVAICDAGHYTSPRGRRVDIAAALRSAKAGTVIYSPERAPGFQKKARSAPTRIEVTNETTFSGVRRMAANGGHVACLNFASAKNPGGGFLNGAQAQEECLARASALYPCLLNAPEYYECNRANHSSLYLDLIIYSPRVPFFRDDAGRLLEEPVLASVITAPAPNAGAVATGEPRNSHLITPALKRRAELILQIAAAHAVDSLVLGAWGCGVFRNNPKVVAALFRDLLQQDRYRSAFSEVVFAVYDRGHGSTFQAFAEALK